MSRFSASRSRSWSRRNRARLQVEALEDRCTPSAILSLWDTVVPDRVLDDLLEEAAIAEESSPPSEPNEVESGIALNLDTGQIAYSVSVFSTTDKDDALLKRNQADSLRAKLKGLSQTSRIPVGEGLSKASPTDSLALGKKKDTLGRSPAHKPTEKTPSTVLPAAKLGPAKDATKPATPSQKEKPERPSLTGSPVGSKPKSPSTKAPALAPRQLPGDDAIPFEPFERDYAYRFFGTCPKLEASGGNLLLPEDLHNERTFRWFSSDDTLGGVETGPVLASTWTFRPATNLGPARLFFSGTVLAHGGPATTITGIVVFGPFNRATVDVIRGGTHVRYTLGLQSHLDLTIHRPPVLDPAETSLRAAQEFELGAQTWVNLDNDDRDASFDNGDNPVPGEDDMIRLTVRMAGTGVATGTARISVEGNHGSIRIWQTPDKQVGTEYLPGTPLAGFAPDGAGGLQKILWVEGVGPHTAQRETRLFLSHDSPDFINVGDAVSVTVLGVEGLEWSGRGNGFTPGSNNHDSDTLDRLATPAGIDSYRVFADARAPNFNVARDTVDVRVRLTVAPVEPVNVFLRAFDVDDPSNETAFIDPNDLGVGGNYPPGTEPNAPLIPYTAHEDNRGAVAGFKAGLLTGQDGNGIVALRLPAGAISGTQEFRVSHHPGDNYRVVANGDRDFLLTLRNRDHDDGFRIVDPAVAGDAAAREVRQANNYVSLPLTVWRLLHLEIDSMGPVTGNAVFGNIVGFASVGGPPNSTRVNTLTVDVNLDDGSPNLGDAPPENGQFENGQLQLVPDVGGTFRLRGNSNTALFPDAPPVDILGNPLPFSALDKNNTQIIRGTVHLITLGTGVWNMQFTLTFSSHTPITWPDFLTGTISIGAGPAMNITGVVPAAGNPPIGTIQVAVGSLRIPFKLLDDDAATMPTMPDTSHLPVAFGDAYILPVVDGAGNPDFNRDTVPFQTHVIQGQATRDNDLVNALNLPGAMESLGNRTNVYWGAYVLAAYESSRAPVDFSLPGAPTPDLRGDSDPDSEMALRGVRPGGVRGVLVFIEEARDRDAKDSAANPRFVRPSLPRVVTHEVGHLFDLPEGGPGDGVMGPDIYYNANVRFVPRDLNRIRSRVASP